MFWIEYILFGITMLGVIFAVYRTFRDPDELAATSIAVLNVRLETLQVAVAKLVSNDIPHIDARIEDIHSDVAQLRVLVTQLATIIEERIPHK